MANILVVDDEAEIVDLVSLHLQSAGHTVTACTHPSHALTHTLETIDLAILDVMMPDMDGFTLCFHLREQGHVFPIIMLTAKDGDTDKISGLTLGADDYMSKPFNPQELLARVSAQLRRATRYAAGGKAESGKGVLYCGGLCIDEAAHSCTLYQKPVELTPIEFQILLLLCKNCGKVMSSEAIFEAVWGEKYLESNNTVMVHVQKLRQKLGDTAKQKKFIHTVWGVGYIVHDKV